VTDGLARLAFRKMEKIFGRSRQSLGEGIADLEKAGLLVAKRANGGQSTYQLNIPRILDEVQPHLTWIADALGGQADLTGQVELTVR
jgi:hypothetical protein